MKIISWNVNGIRACEKKGMLQWLQKESPDIFCVQETKVTPELLPKTLSEVEGYHSYWNYASRKGYAGTAVFSKEELESVITEFPKNPKFEEDGRVLRLDYPEFTLLNIYFPNGGTRADGTEMLSYKLAFYDEMTQYAKDILNSGKEIILCGDFNVAHEEIDLARPKENKDSIGFLPIERARLSTMLDAGFIDCFRELHPKEVSYTWWSMRTRARARNVGWRLDYFLASKSLFNKAKSCLHMTEVTGSDHCPIRIDI